MAISIVPQGWGEASIQEIFSILRSVHEVFSPCFGSAMNFDDLLIIRALDYPVTYKEYRIILLATADRYWCQYAYQFAHEYCHYQIQDKVPLNLKWFEESLCELASYYFLPLITELWKKNPPYTGWDSYADRFSTYVLNDQKKAESFDLDLASNPTMLKYLAANEYDRGKNAYVATAIMPIFIENPSLWSTVPLLGGIPDDLSFADSLRFWRDRAPDCHQRSIQRISEVFSLEI